ncbi:Variable outer membrane protein [Borrelia duttonii CR2A]|uniref:Variable outer membrane protein n=1 Tax=Borrelia duttonii CR2A TaxID=1432657 RepID=W6TFQ4_9SPIR|nr:Variable outer membrane protein [Borrelia duttonii CR2A]
MKREGKEGEIKGKRGIERGKRMKRIVKGIMVMMMIVMRCNSGVKDPEKVFLSEMVNWGKDF